MVAVTHREADRFISGTVSQMDIFLVFGTDAGLISERTKAILKRTGVDTSNADQVTRLEGDDIAANPGRLFEEAHAISLFAERRAIVLRAGSKQILGALETLLDNPAKDCKIVVQAGALRKDAPLRALITRAKNAAAIECYPDQAKDVERLIDTCVKEAGLTIDQDARHALVGLLGDDRLSTRSELEKLLLYAHGRGRITEADVIDAVANASAFALDHVIFAAFSGDLSFLGDAGSNVYSSPNEVFPLLAAAARHAQMLNQIRIEIETGLSVENAIDRSAGRSVFGSRRDALVTQANHWRRSALTACTQELNRTTLETRREPSLAIAIAMQALLMIARRYRSMRSAA